MTRTIHQERFHQRLLRWIHRCPKCQENSLLLGVKEGTAHICRSCRHRFTINRETQVWKPSQETTVETQPFTNAQALA